MADRTFRFGVFADLAASARNGSECLDGLAAIATVGLSPSPRIRFARRGQRPPLARK